MYSCWDDQKPLSWDNVLNTLSGLGPVFPCNADEIEILSTPTEFYQSLLDHASNANDRILISSLYIGQGERERHLVDAISECLDRNENVKVSMLMDHCRSQRGIDQKQSSLHTLLPLLDSKYENQFNLHLFRTPNLRGLWSWFPERTREVAGVHHMKAFIFDDTLIVSGANLNETYLNNRQDRYFVLKNQSLTNHVYGMLDVLRSHCPNVQYNAFDDSFTVDMNVHHVDLELDSSTNTAVMNDAVTLNPETEPQKWFEFLCDQIRPFTDPRTAGNETNTSSNSNGDEDTFIVLGTQMMDQLHTDSAITSCLLSMPRNEMKIGTAYFNLAERYKQILYQTYNGMIHHQKGRLEVLTASEQCNSFYKARGMAGYVTPIYELFAKQFEEAIGKIYGDYSNDGENSKEKEELKDRFVFHRYNRKEWTYHGKGIWMDIEEEKEDPFSLTLIGSSNYGERSVGRDTELNFTVLTRNEALRSRLGAEWSNLTRFTDETTRQGMDGNVMKVGNVEDDRVENVSDDEKESSGFMTNILSGLARNFM